MTSLRQLAPNLWEIEWRGMSGPLEMRYRMTVVRWAGDRLWLHSPIAIDDRLAEQFAALGHVTDIVAPNRFHHLHAGSTKQRYPEARLWAAPGLQTKRSDLPANPHDAANAATRMLWKALGVWQRAGQNRFFRMMTRDRAAMDACIEELLGWDIERVVMAHGEILETDAKSVLIAALGHVRASTGP